MIYLQLLLVALAATYVVDVSGFTQSWRSLLARWLRVREDALRELPPFDCGKCATFWACLLWAALHGELTLPVFAACCAAALLSQSFSALMIFLCEALAALIDKITPNR